MKILAMCPLVFMDVQIEIHKAFIYTLYTLSRQHEVTLVIDQRKRYREYEKRGWLSDLQKCGVQTVYTGNILLNKNEHKEYEVDKSFLDKFGGGYDELFVYAAPMANVPDVKKKIGHYLHTGKCPCTFNSMLSKYNTYLQIFMLQEKYGLQIKHMIVDYREPRLDAIFTNVITFGCYEDRAHEIYNLFLYENYLFRKGVIDKEKHHKFVFGYTITYKERKYLSGIISNGIREGRNYALFARDRFWKGVGRDDAIDQIQYYKMIEQAKFSLVVPANNPHEFSMQRFWECLSRKCIPLLLDRNNVENAFYHYKDVLEYYKTHKLFWHPDQGSLNDLTNSLNYDILIDEIYNLSSMKMLTNKKAMQGLLLTKYGGNYE